MWMLDTNVCSFVMKQRPASYRQRFDDLGHENLAISTIVLAELRFGAARHRTRSELYFAEIADFACRLAVLAWNESAASHYAQIRSDLERQGRPIGNLDLLIAAHALAEDAVVVTHNVRKFERVPGLRVENWG